MTVDFKKDLKPDSSNEPLYGFYRGVVLDNRDRGIEKEGKTYGRIKVHIPSLMDDEEVGIWAYPGNNPMGGRNTESISKKKDANGGKQEYSGSMIVPPSNSWVWIFFENGDPNRPYYFGSVDVRAHEAPPEIQINTNAKPEERWLVFRSPQGRVITISDDPDNCRIEITGKKRKGAGNSDDHVYSVVGNQKTILIDERDGKEKILIEDEKGNFVNINTKDDDIDIHANRTIRITAGKSIYIKAPHVGINGDDTMRIVSPDLRTNSGGDIDKPANGDR